LVLFSGILAFYNSTIFFIFLGSSVLYVVWIVAFLKRRRDLDFKRYSASSSNQESLFQLIQGMQEIKLHNCETQKRWEWERIQATLYTISYKGLQLDQLQQAGAFAINEGKNILITFLAAKAVIDGQMTLGMMLSVQYIIGQLNAPIEQLIGFMHTAQDAKISLERLSEIHNQPDEEQDTQEQLNELPANKTITLSNVSFQYDAISNGVLNDVSLTIPQGKITAIVGTSGSGKTTLLKLLLGFYAPTKGTITVGATPHHSISHHVWRASTGVVMQDGFIFNDTIAKNIAVGHEVIQQEQLIKASHTANIQPFIDELPLGYATKIGNDGHGLSVGQKQRLLIARAVYKNPDYILFDEATNALDANNESIIMKNLNTFFIGRTVVVVAHRLSTVKNAHNIVVLHNGAVVEQGTHAQLIALKGGYYELVKNQLELN
jgi:ATP-binding cassette subfamily B protein